MPLTVGSQMVGVVVPPALPYGRSLGLRQGAPAAARSGPEVPGKSQASAAGQRRGTWFAGLVASGALVARAQGRSRRREPKTRRRVINAGPEPSSALSVSAHPIAPVHDAPWPMSEARSWPSRPGRSVESPAVVIQRLYDSFNCCDADGTAECFTEDIVYEDLLLGNSTIVNSREEFRELIGTHPVFVASRVCEALRVQRLDVKVKVDNISEDMVRHTCGVSWHVEFAGEPLFLGRGLSFMEICPKTGLIQKAVDIAEAPWRAIGLFFAPLARGLREISRFVRDWSAAPVVLALLFALIFVDRSSLDHIRADIDQVDDFRDSLDSALSQLAKGANGLWPRAAP